MHTQPTLLLSRAFMGFHVRLGGGGGLESIRSLGQYSSGVKIGRIQQSSR